MITPSFSDNHVDKQSFAPFVLVDQRHTQWQDVRLTFSDWDWLGKMYVDDTIDGYYLNGYGIQGLVMACRLAAGWEPETERIHYNSEGDSCQVYFKSLEEAVRTAAAAAQMIQDRATLEAMIQLARANGFED